MTRPSSHVRYGARATMCDTPISCIRDIRPEARGRDRTGRTFSPSSRGERLLRRSMAFAPDWGDQCQARAEEHHERSDRKPKRTGGPPEPANTTGPSHEVERSPTSQR